MRHRGRALLLLLAALGPACGDGECPMPEEWSLDEMVREADVTGLLADKGYESRAQIACEELCEFIGEWDDPASRSIDFCMMELSDAPGPDAQAIVGSISCAGTRACD